MRALFSGLGLLLVVLVVGLLARKQLTSAAVPPAPTAAVSGGQAGLSGSPQEQVRQFQKALQDSLQAPRPDPDAAK